jgi:hypothetical protein
MQWRLPVKARHHLRRLGFAFLQFCVRSNIRIRSIFWGTVAFFRDHLEAKSLLVALGSSPESVLQMFVGCDTNWSAVAGVKDAEAIVLQFISEHLRHRVLKIYEREKTPVRD